MKPLYTHCLAILLLTTQVKSQGPCGERNVIGAVGGAVTLQVTGTGTRSISWSFGEKGVIASTRPGGELEVQDRQYEGRLIGSSDGSLTITNLQHEDQGTYRAKNIDLECWYDVSVFSNLTEADLTISPNVTNNNETCELILTCSVTSAKTRNVTVTWRSLNSSVISPKYSVTVPANHTNFTYICTASNPVSEASKSVTPREYCQNGNRNMETAYLQGRHYILRVLIPIIPIIILIIIVIMYVCYTKRQKTKLKTKTYVESGVLLLDLDDEDTEIKEMTGHTLYSTVQHVKGKNGRKPAPPAPNGNGSNPLLETCYAQVNLPQESKKEQNMSSEGANSDCPTAPVESHYEKVQHLEDKENLSSRPSPPNKEPPQKPPHSRLGPPKGQETQKASPEGASGDLTNTSEDANYEKLQHSKDKKNVKIRPTPPNKEPPPKPPHSKLGPSKDKNSHKVSPAGANGDVPKPPEEALYEEVPNHKGGASQEPARAAVESIYAQAILPKWTEPANDSVQYCEKKLMVQDASHPRSLSLYD